MILGQIAVNNLKCKIIFLINGIRGTGIKETPRKYRSELKQLSKELQTYISFKEYKNFFSDILEIPLENAVEEAENILKDSKDKGDLNNG